MAECPLLRLGRARGVSNSSHISAGASSTTASRSTSLVLYTRFIPWWPGRERVHGVCNKRSHPLVVRCVRLTPESVVVHKSSSYPEDARAVSSRCSGTQVDRPQIHRELRCRVSSGANRGFDGPDSHQASPHRWRCQALVLLPQAEGPTGTRRVTRSALGVVSRIRWTLRTQPTRPKCGSIAAR